MEQGNNNQEHNNGEQFNAAPPESTTHEQVQAAPQGGGQPQSQSHDSEAPAPEGAETGGGDHKTFAIVGYILPILFFLPLLNEGSKNDPFARFHASQQLNLLILAIVLFMVLPMVVPMTFYYGGFFMLVHQLLNLAVLVLAILGIVNAVKGEMKELPVIGGFNLLK